MVGDQAALGPLPGVYGSPIDVIIPGDNELDPTLRAQKPFGAGQ